MKAQVILKDRQAQAWLAIVERRSYGSYCMAGGKMSWDQYIGRTPCNRLAAKPLRGDQS